MKDRIQIDGVWYKREREIPTEADGHDLIPYHGFTWEDEKVCFELTILLDEDYKFTKHSTPSLEVTFKEGHKNQWKIDYWDNSKYLLKSLEGEYDAELFELFNSGTIITLKTMLKKAVDLGWFEHVKDA